ncbi:MAG: CoA transferase [Pseudonocardia sp.]|nr:CoA transferase [Pseudonocardia sp.]
MGATLDIGTDTGPDTDLATGADLPLDGIRIVDLTDGPAAVTTRLLADLGADVVRVEPPCGSPARHREPLVAGVGVHHVVHNANKRSLVLAAGRALPGGPDHETFRRLVASAQILVHDRSPGRDTGLTADALLALNPRLVVVAVTAFGQDGPYRDWAVTDEVLHAMSGALSRSGRPGLPPLPPPAPIAGHSAAVQAAWATLVAYANAQRTGVGDLVDVSLHEATAHAIDPSFGISGSATGGARVIASRDRPDVAHLYPIFPCADGDVRICVLSPRQWHGMRAWLGEPEEFTAPAYDLIGVRFEARDRLYPLITALFADRTRDEIVEEGQKLGVPVAGVLTPGEALDNEHFAARGAWTDVDVAPGQTARIPAGAVELDGVRAGIRRRAPGLGEHTVELLAELEAAELEAAGPVRAPAADRAQPLAGLRVLDLGVIVVGAEMGRLFADQGAEVIKIETRGFPDGSRQTVTDVPITPSFVWGHRGKLGLGLNLRDPEGAVLFRALVAESDVVLTNFKPGTMESLGLGYAELAAVNPDVVVVDSSAFGSSGPWSRRMGYGPLVRASTGLSELWRYPAGAGGDGAFGDGAFGDGATVYPDHVAARLGAVGALATLLARRRRGRGGQVGVSQAEAILGQLADVVALESRAPGSGVAWVRSGPDAPRGPFACAGDDEWCVVAVRDDTDWGRLCRVLGRPELADDPAFATAAARRGNREAIEAIVSPWTGARPAREVMTTLQRAGVPAAMMHRLTDHADDPHLRARGYFRLLHQPQLDELLPTENGPAVFRNTPEPVLRPAPLQGEHTEQVVGRILGIPAQRIGELVDRGVLEVRTARP